MEKKAIKREYKAKKKRLCSKYKNEKRDIREGYLNSLGELYESEGKHRPVDPPRRALLEEIGNAVTHGAGTLFSVIALVLMCIAADRTAEYVGAALYAFGQLAMFTMSCLYHAFRHGSKVKRIFRRFDYSGIYLMIGATFAPILLCYSQGRYSLLFLIAQWVLIALGVTFIGIYGPTKLKWLHNSLYILLGWCGVIFIPEMLQRGDVALFAYILGGGVIYTAGIIPFALKGRAAHFIWHFFVLAGAIVQWLGIYTVIYLT